MSTYYRIQDRQYGTEGLFDRERVTYDMSYRDETARRGVSCCGSLQELIEYYVQAPVEIGTDPVIIIMEGEPSGDTPLDAHLGEHLIHPTRIIDVIDAEEAGFFDGVNALLDD